MGSVTDGPTVQELQALQGGGGGFTGDNPGGDPNWMMQQQPDRNALAGLMAQQQPRGNPYAGMGGFGGGGGGVPNWLQQQQARDAEWQRINEANDPYGVDQYFGNMPTQSGSITDTGWMYALQPYQGGVTSGGQPGTPATGQYAGYMGGGGATRASPSYWQNEFRTGTGGLDPNDYRIFAQQVGEQAAQEWVRAGGVGSMGGFGGGGGMGGVGAAGPGGGSGAAGPGGGGGPSGNNPTVGAAPTSVFDTGTTGVTLGVMGNGPFGGGVNLGGLMGTPSTVGTTPGFAQGLSGTLGAPGAGSPLGGFTSDGFTFGYGATGDPTGQGWGDAMGASNSGVY